MKIGLYVWEDTLPGKKKYKNECYDARPNAGMSVVKDVLESNGLCTEYVGVAGAHKCDWVLVGMGSDHDWWRFIAERVRWQAGSYKCVVGGPACLNVRPFLQYADYFVLGRAENVIYELVSGRAITDSVVCSKTFSMEKTYSIAQADAPYPNTIVLPGGKLWKEQSIGCPHKCFFCGYTWHRKHVSALADERYTPYDSLSSRQHQEAAMLDYIKGYSPDYTHLRTTAIDGLSERMRFSANKMIKNKDVVRFFVDFYERAVNRQLKLFNVLGFPGETEMDWREFIEVLREADRRMSGNRKPMGITLNSTPFRPYPATPMACAPISRVEYRGLLVRVLGEARHGQGKHPHTIYEGENLWVNENTYTQSLASSMLSNIVWRGTETDADNVEKIAVSRTFEGASVLQKIATLEKYFNIDKIYCKYSPETLPTRYLRTYADVERFLGCSRQGLNKVDGCGL